jgi:hypothetical protein
MMEQKYFRFQYLMKLVVLANAESHVLVLLQLSISIAVTVFFILALSQYVSFSCSMGRLHVNKVTPFIRFHFIPGCIHPYRV